MLRSQSVKKSKCLQRHEGHDEQWKCERRERKHRVLTDQAEGSTGWDFSRIPCGWSYSAMRVGRTGQSKSEVGQPMVRQGQGSILARVFVKLLR